jgi:opacity protein-like surface antigen
MPLRKFTSILSVALLAAAALSAPASASWVVTAGQFIGSGGPGTGESLAGNRFRSFGNTGGNENYLGIPSLGNPSPQRVERGISWSTSSLTSYDFTFQYDQASDKLISTIASGSLEYTGWSTKLAGFSKTKGARAIAR